MNIAILALATAAAWLIWSGLYKTLLLCLGVASVLLVLVLVRRMDLDRREVFVLDLAPRLLRFWGWLVVDIVRSNLRVARIVLSPRLPISPTWITIEAAPQGRIGRATLANSITLTPGTLTVDAHHGRLLIHALTAQGAAELERSDMGQRVVAALGDR